MTYEPCTISPNVDAAMKTVPPTVPPPLIWAESAMTPETASL